MVKLVNTPEFAIPVGDGLHVNARLSGSAPKSVLLFIHGLGGSKDELLPYEIARHFSPSWAVLRFDLYDWSRGTRDLIDCTLATHAADTEKVIAWARQQGFTNIFLIGHSYGGLTALMVGRQDVAGVVLLDPTHPKSKIFNKEGLTPLPEIAAYWMRPGVGHVVSQAQLEEFEALKVDQLLQNYRTPTLVCSAGKGVLTETNHDYWKRLHDQGCKASFTKVSQADHSFNDDRDRALLFRSMGTWLWDQTLPDEA